MGFYSVVVKDNVGSIESSIGILTVASGTGSRLVNVSTRGFVPMGGSLTPGFVLRGTGTKQLVIRAVGPTLSVLGTSSPLPDPRLNVIAQGAIAALFSNDDWGGSANLASACASVGAFALPSTSKDAVVQAGLRVSNLGAYTVRVDCASAVNSGVALAEVYDADAPISPVRLINLSTLGFVGSNTNVLASGFVVGGDAPKQLLIRAVGPGLAPLGVDGFIADPQMAVVPLGWGFTIASNDDWDGAAATSATFTQAGAFALASGSKDAALVVRLPPGGYTVTVTGAGNTTGTALVEIYDLDP